MESNLLSYQSLHVHQKVRMTLPEGNVEALMLEKEDWFKTNEDNYVNDILGFMHIFTSVSMKYSTCQG